MVAVLDAERALMNGHKDNDHPQRYINSSVVVHASAVRNIAWHGVIDPVNFASCGSDGCVFIHDPQDPGHPIMYSRTRSKWYLARGFVVRKDIQCSCVFALLLKT